jgi:hypothetical protein
LGKAPDNSPSSIAIESGGLLLDRKFSQQGMDLVATQARRVKTTKPLEAPKPAKRLARMSDVPMKPITQFGKDRDRLNPRQAATHLSFVLLDGLEGCLDGSVANIPDG